MTSLDSAATRDIVGDIFREAGLGSDAVDKRPNKRGELMRGRLVAAAAECFAEYGYVRTRVSDVVHRAGTAQGNFYRHFSSLDEIFLTVLRPAVEELASPTPRRKGRSADLTSLITVNTEYLRSYARHRNMIRLLREAAAASSNDGFLQVWLILRGHFVAQVRSWLGRLAETGQIEDRGLNLLAESLGCLTEQLAYVHVGLPSTTPRPERIDELGEALGEAWFRLLPRPSEPSGV